MTYLGYSGLLSTLAQGGVPPVTKSTITLQLAGMLGAFGIVAALHGRDRIGQGCRVDANMVDAATWMVAEDLTRAANAPAPAWPPFATRANYRCSDGKWVTCTSSEPRSWAAVVEALDVPELGGYRPGTDDEATAARLAEVFASRPQAAWLEAPGLAGGIGPVYEAADLVVDPQLTHRRAMVPLDGDGPLVLANPLRIDGALGDEGSHALGMAPELGQDTDATLARAGYSAEEIAGLHDDGVV
jgi:crotonobetainyl-CoA:carnitine CoA-transferase CaiB-like acyl-CoA transferase